MKKVVFFLAVFATALQLHSQDFCWMTTKTRSLSAIGPSCTTGLQYDAGLCYTACNAGFKGVGPVCWAVCPAGFTDIGVSCQKPAAYGRGTGFVSNAACGGNCQQGPASLLWYPFCQANFSPAGCCICSPNCPTGFRDDGAFCAKTSYGRGAGSVPTECGVVSEKSNALCYQLCPFGYTGLGPLCYAKCPANFPTKCGFGCAKSSAACLSPATTPVKNSAELMSSILNTAFTVNLPDVANNYSSNASTLISAIKGDLSTLASTLKLAAFNSSAESTAKLIYEAERISNFRWSDLNTTQKELVVRTFTYSNCQ